MPNFYIVYGPSRDSKSRAERTLERAVGAAATRWTPPQDISSYNAAIIERGEDRTEKTIVETQELLRKIQDYWKRKP